MRKGNNALIPTPLLTPRQESSDKISARAKREKQKYVMRCIQAITLTVAMAITSVVEARGGLSKRSKAEPPAPAAPVAPFVPIAPGIPVPSVAKTNVDRFVESFPEDLKNVEVCHKDAHPGSKHLLIFIRQHHWGGDKAKHVKITEDCQQEIYALLEELFGEGLIDDVYDERIMMPGETPKPEPESRTVEGVHGSDMAYMGAAMVLSSKNKALPLKGTQMATSYDDAREALRDPNMTEEEFNRRVFTVRENDLLRIIAEARDDIACTVYGADHAWNDNIRKWNKANPDKKFSVITLSTKTVVKECGKKPRSQDMFLKEILRNYQGSLAL